jgi:phytoene dehydrogenase-like protein
MRAAGQTYDAVVIGAGHNGLVAANLLADAGWSVLVLESGPSPGGSVRSGLLRPGYLMDLCSSFFPLGVASPVLTGLRLQEHGLHWVYAPQTLTHLFADGRTATIHHEPARTALSVEQFSLGDGARWLAECQRWQHLAPALLPALLGPFPPAAATARLLRRLRIGGGLRLARQALLPARTFSGELFTGEGARMLLAGSALHTDLGPDDAAGGIYGWLMTMLAQQVGFPVPQGGAQRITDALAARLRTRGGEINYNTHVVRVPVRSGRAGGALTADGRRFTASRAVIADVPAPALYLDLVGSAALPSRLVDDLRHFRWDGATVKLDFALSGPVPWLGGQAGEAGTLHIGADLNGLTRYAAELACGEMPRDPFLIVGQMTTADPLRSPPGTQSLWAYTHLPHRAEWAADEVAEHADRVQDVLERHAPGFGALVLARRVAGPAELEAENPSLVGGAIGGGTAAAYQQLFLRPIPGLGRADTPIDRLFLASSSAHPGGGVHGAPGANAARAALARDRAVTGALYRALISRANAAIYRA